MKPKITLRLNIVCYLILGGFLTLFLVLSFSSGYPWSAICYNCASCSRTCVLGINPNGFVMAAMSDNPDLPITVLNIRLRLEEAARRDPEMILVLPGGTRTTAGEAIAAGTARDLEVTTIKMKARDVAQYCLLCGNCEKDCSVNLPIMTIIEDLRDDGKFNR